MKFVTSDYDGQHDELCICPIGDLHIGAPNFNQRELEKHLQWIDRNRDNTRIIIMGDLAETATKDSVGAGWFEQEEGAQQQMMKAKALLYPYRDLIDGIVTGNHEQRIYQKSGLDIMQYFAQLMDLEHKYLRYQGVIKYAWNKRAYTVSVWHGAGGGSTPGGAMNKLQKQANTVLADVYLMGHVHKRMAHSQVTYVPDVRNNKMQQMKQYFVVTGSALDYEGTYAEEKGLNPSLIGFPKIYLGGRTESTSKHTRRVKEVRVEI